MCAVRSCVCAQSWLNCGVRRLVGRGKAQQAMKHGGKQQTPDDGNLFEEVAKDTGLHLFLEKTSSMKFYGKSLTKFHTLHGALDYDPDVFSEFFH